MMKNRPWSVKRPQKEKIAAMEQALGVPALLAGVLLARGVEDPEAARTLLAEPAPMSDPFLLKDMDKAVERLHRALDNGETIVIFGDYDVDGITATALLYQHLKNLGGDVKCKLPTRQGEGYGLNRQALDSVYGKGYRLIVTVDNGISAVEEADYARQLGIDLIITDHHLPPDPLPAAYAVVDPMQADDPSPFKFLCGAGVAFKLCAALEGCAPEDLLEYCGDLAAIGTVADVMPIVDENRTIVRAGLEMLQNTERPGLIALLRAAGVRDASGSAPEKPIGADTISYMLAPRLNAAGRMEDPTLALRLMLSEDLDRAMELARHLEELNSARRRLVQEMTEGIIRQLDEHPDRLNDRVLMVWGECFHPGLIGIVASRLAERYHRPAVVIALQDGEGRGSGRSIAGISLHDALSECEDLLIRYGGHAQAAGLSVRPENIEPLRRALNGWMLRNYPVQPAPEHRMDLSVRMGRITVEEVEALQHLAPYGSGNPAPQFMLERVTIEGIWPVGDGKHSRLRLRQGSEVFSAVWFGVAPQAIPYPVGFEVDLCVCFTVYRGKAVPEISPQLLDMRPAGMGNTHCQHQALVEAFVAGVPMDDAQRRMLTPERADTVAVYRQIQAGQVPAEDLRSLFARLGEDKTARLLVSLEALRQVDLIRPATDRDGRMVWQAVPATGKKDLWQAPVLKALDTRQQDQPL